MKIGIISDIHAELQPLLIALSIFKREKVDQIICAGDIVDGGTEGDAVVDIIKQQAILCVLGNHDEMVFSDQALIRQRMRKYPNENYPYLLQSSTVAYVHSLPLTQYFTFEDYRVCLAHGTPTQNTHYVFPDSHISRFQGVIDDAQSDILILGHTHMPMCVQVNDKWILNAGSTYRNRHADNRTCAILKLPDIQFNVYDLDTRERVNIKSGNNPRTI